MNDRLVSAVRDTSFYLLLLNLPSEKGILYIWAVAPASQQARYCHFASTEDAARPKTLGQTANFLRQQFYWHFYSFWSHFLYYFQLCKFEELQKYLFKAVKVQK
jgi:hypothetical protein